MRIKAVTFALNYNLRFDLLKVKTGKLLHFFVSNATSMSCVFSRHLINWFLKKVTFHKFFVLSTNSNICQIA